jgi:hypothetical protein
MILSRFLAVFAGIFCMAITDALAVGIVGTPGPRPSIAGRMPTMPTMTLASGRIVTIGGGGTTTGGSFLTQGDGCNVVGLGTCDSIQPDTMTSNRCTQRYLACLKTEAVCGSNFELCDTAKRFEAKRFMCQESLALCPAGAIQSLFGLAKIPIVEEKRMTCDGESVVVQRKFNPDICTGLTLNYKSGAREQESLIGTEIMNGAEYVAKNAIKTCQNTADACIENACRSAPFKCTTVDRLSNANYTEIANLISTSGSTSPQEATRTRVRPQLVEQYVKNMSWEKDNMFNYLKGACKVEIGGSKACFMMVEERAPKNGEEEDELNMGFVYDAVMTGEINRLNANQAKIHEWLALSVRNTMDRCTEATRQCVVSACGHGSLAMCYGQAIAHNPHKAVKLQDIPYIGGQCESVINANQDCADVLANGNNREVVWDRIWNTSGNDTLGIQEQLNLELTQLFNETALQKKRKACVDYADACVLRQCGKNYESCLISGDYVNGAHRNETFFGGSNPLSTGDVLGLLTGSYIGGGFSKSMAMGLCLIPVKKNQDCADWFDVQFAKVNSGMSADSWNSPNNARNAWLGSYGAKTNVNGEDMFCRSSVTYSKLTETRDITDTDPEIEDYSHTRTTETSSRTEHCAKIEQNLFDDLINDAAQTAQSMLSRKKAQEKAWCEAKNNGAKPSAFQWVKAAGMAAPTGSIAAITGGIENFELRGFATPGTPTTDLFGSFCQVTILLSSSDANVERCLTEGSDSHKPGINRMVHTSAGRTHACGSQISGTQLEKFNNCLEELAKKQAEKDIKASGFQQILPWLTGAAGAGLGAWGLNALTNSQLNKVEKERERKNDKQVDDRLRKLLNQRLDCAAGVNKVNPKTLYAGDASAYCENNKDKCGAIVGSDERWAPIEAAPNGNIEKLMKECGEQAALLRKAEGVVDQRNTGVNKAPWQIGSAIVGGVGGGLLIGLTTKSLIDQSIEGKRDEQVKKWFETIGNKIECKINGKIVARYLEEIQL